MPEQAAIVHRIFEDYAAGVSPKAICRKLNAEFAPPPRGKLWSPSALIGSAERGTGILRNPLYKGVIVWNKIHMVKDPETGRRVSRPNPESAWQTADAPELRIVPDGLFETVRRQLASRAHRNRADNIVTQRRPKRLLSGLLKCGACGSGMAVAGPDKSGRVRLRCSAHTNSGACPDLKTFYLEVVEELVIDSLTKELAVPDQIYIYAKAYMEKRRAEAAHDHRRRADIEARLTAIEKDNARLTDWALKGLGDEAELLSRAKAQAEERDSLKVELARLPQGSNIIVHPASIKAFAEKLRASRPKLGMALYMLDDMGELSRLIREVIQSITLSHDEDGMMTMKVISWLEPFLEGEGKATKTPGQAGGVIVGSGGPLPSIPTPTGYTL